MEPPVDLNAFFDSVNTHEIHFETTLDEDCHQQQLLLLMVALIAFR